MKKTLYITQETQDRLAKLGGPTPSENIRRAVALAEVAEELSERVENLEESIQFALDNPPEYHEQGMGCGLEDRNITDRYEAMKHGWDEAIERVYSECMPPDDLMAEKSALQQYKEAKQ